MKLIEFINSIDCDSHLTETVIAAYRVIYEGQSDVDSLKYYSDIFNRIVQAISNKHNSVTISNGNIKIRGDLFNTPNIIFSSSVSSGFDELSKTINVNVSDLHQDQPLSEMIELIKHSKSDCIHELIHFRDSQYKGNRRAFLKTHGVEGMSRLNELSARVKYLTDLEKDNWMVDTAYFNNQTERNAYIIQYIWKCIVNMLSKPNVNITFTEFISPLMNSHFYTYLLPSARKRVIKRIYYVWDSIVNAMPDLVLLDSNHMDSLLSLLGKRTDTNISPMVESQSEIAAGEFGFHVDCDPMVRGYASHLFDKTKTLSNQHVFIESFVEGSIRINHTRSVSGGSEIKIINIEENKFA